MLRNTTTTADDILNRPPWRAPPDAPSYFYGVGKAPGFIVTKMKAGTLGRRDVLPLVRAYPRRRAIDVLRAQARRPQFVRVDGDEVELGCGLPQAKIRRPWTEVHVAAITHLAKSRPHRDPIFVCW